MFNAYPFPTLTKISSKSRFKNKFNYFSSIRNYQLLPKLTIPHTYNLFLEFAWGFHSNLDIVCQYGDRGKISALIQKSGKSQILMIYPHIRLHQQTSRESHSVPNTTFNIKTWVFFLRAAVNRILFKKKKNPLSSFFPFNGGIVDLEYFINISFRCTI